MLVGTVQKCFQAEGGVAVVGLEAVQLVHIWKVPLLNHSEESIHHFQGWGNARHNYVSELAPPPMGVACAFAHVAILSDE